jgi:hypothetical protein
MVDVARAMRNSAKNFLNSGVLVLSMLSAIPAIGEETALDRYVAAPDPSYRYQLIETIPDDSQHNSRANLQSPSRSAVGGYAVSVQAEPIEET